MSEDKTLLRALCDALSTFVPPEHDVLDAAEAVMAAIGIPAATLSALRSGEMSDAMMDAGQWYLDDRALSGSFHLPGTFNWHEFWRAMLAAAKDARHD